MAHLSGVQVHFAVSAWFLFAGKGEATGDVCHFRMARIRIACSSCRRPACGKVTIYLRNGKGNGENFFLREVGEEMLNGWYIKKLQL